MTTAMHTTRIQVAGETIEVREEEPGYFLGTIEVCGVQHHVELIQVVGSGDAQEPFVAGSDDAADNCNRARYESMSSLNDNEPFQMIEVDGRDFVCVISPFGT